MVKRVMWLILFVPYTALGQIVCIGDSVTRSTPYVVLGDGYCERVNGRNAGIGGQTSLQGLARFRSDVLARKPRTVVIMFGLNDAALQVPLAAYRRAMRRMVKLSKGRAILMTSNPYCNDTAQNRALLPYVLAVREIAKRERVPLVDNYRTFAEAGLVDYLPGYYSDALHPNALGQGLIASGLRAVLKPT